VRNNLRDDKGSICVLLGPSSSGKSTLLNTNCGNIRIKSPRSFNRSLEHGRNIFGEQEKFDGKQGLSSHNKTDQMKVEDENSTFFNPRFFSAFISKAYNRMDCFCGQARRVYQPQGLD
jgi:energy-coupling factor transporter ATP-binding protein EcfA2